LRISLSRSLARAQSLALAPAFYQGRSELATGAIAHLHWRRPTLKSWLKQTFSSPVS
jgi:hypothetical protein